VIRFNLYYGLHIKKSFVHELTSKFEDFSGFTLRSVRQPIGGVFCFEDVKGIDFIFHLFAGSLSYEFMVKELK
jgi:hypothetical protein